MKVSSRQAPLRLGQDITVEDPAEITSLSAYLRVFSGTDLSNVVTSRKAGTKVTVSPRQRKA